MTDEKCRIWYEGDHILEGYHDNEWCKVAHDDQSQFEMLCLEGASVGLSWKTIMYKRENYRRAFHDFDTDTCAKMSDDELGQLLSDSDLIRNRNKIFSARKNAQVMQEIQKELGSSDVYLRSPTDSKQIDNKWKTPEDVPTVFDLSERLSKDMKKHGIGFVGLTITYSLL